MAGKSLWCHDGAAFWKFTSGICWTSALWGLGKAVYRDVSHWRHSLQNRLRGTAGAAPGRHVLIPEGCPWHRTSCLCFRSLSPESSRDCKGWVLEKQSVRVERGAGEAVCTGEVGCWRSHSYRSSWYQRSHPCCKGLVGEKLHALHKPDAREASGSAGACWASMLKPGRKFRFCHLSPVPSADRI